MAANARKKQGENLPLKLRLKAWWEGYDPAEVEQILRAQGKKARKSQPAPPAEPERPRDPEIDPDNLELPFDPWDSNRAEVAQYIWGEGYCGPGGPEYIVSMSKLLSLSPEQSLLELGSLLGGPARTLADKFGTWVTGYEASPTLVELANEKSHMAGMSKRVHIHQYDPETVEEFERRFDRAFAKEALFTIQNKAHLFDIVEQHLKPSGLFLVTDFVVADDAVYGKDSYQQWHAAESQRRRPYMVTPQELAELAKQARFTVRVSEDVSDTYVDLIHKAWAGADKVAEEIAQREDGEELVQALLREAEFWSHRAKMLESGDLRLWRMLASKKPESPSMMSDW